MPIAMAPKNAKTTPVVIMLSCCLMSLSSCLGCHNYDAICRTYKEIRYGGAANFCVHPIKLLKLKGIFEPTVVNRTIATLALQPA